MPMVGVPSKFDFISAATQISVHVRGGLEWYIQ